MAEHVDPNAAVPTNVQSGPADRTLIYMQRQKFLQQQSDLMEKEIAARMAIIRTHHTHFTSIASKFVGVLEELARQAFDARDTVLSIARGSSSLAAAASPSPAAPPRAASSVRSYSSPNRVVMTPKTATKIGIASTVELTGAPQLHRRQVAERRMSRELQSHAQLVNKYSTGEHRRSEAHIRREMLLLNKGPARQAATEVHTVEKSKRDADFEIRQRLQRETVREKHEALEERRLRAEHERQAVTSALRKLEDLTSKTVKETESSFRDAAARATHDALAVHEAQLARQKAADAALRKSLTGRNQARASFKREYERQMQRLREDIKKHENEAHIAHAKHVGGAQGVEVVWPSNVVPPQRAKSVKGINDVHYARLCGVKESILRGFGDGGGDHHQRARPIRLEDVAALKHLAPQHWQYIESAEPAMMWEALRAVEAAVVRGPQQVQWK